MLAGSRLSRRRLGSLMPAVLFGFPAAVFGQSPWERAANNRALTFTGPVARPLALVWLSAEFS
jgi:type IV secretory pathway VirB2 component (pilin)